MAAAARDTDEAGPALHRAAGTRREGVPRPSLHLRPLLPQRRPGQKLREKGLTCEEVLGSTPVCLSVCVSKNAHPGASDPNDSRMRHPPVGASQEPGAVVIAGGER